MEAFFWGMLGGISPEVLIAYKYRTCAPGKLPAYFKTIFYYVATLGMATMGGALALAYSLSGNELSVILAINIGASAPLIIGNISKSPVSLD